MLLDNLNAEKYLSTEEKIVHESYIESISYMLQVMNNRLTGLGGSSELIFSKGKCSIYEHFISENQNKNGLAGIFTLEDNPPLKFIMFLDKGILSVERV